MEKTTTEEKTFTITENNIGEKENNPVKLESRTSEETPLTSNKRIISPQTPSLSEHLSKAPTLINENTKNSQEIPRNKDQTTNLSKYSEDSEQLPSKTQNNFLQGKSLAI